MKAASPKDKHALQGAGKGRRHGVWIVQVDPAHMVARKTDNPFNSPRDEEGAPLDIGGTPPILGLTVGEGNGVGDFADPWPLDEPLRTLPVRPFYGASD